MSDDARKTRGARRADRGPWPSEPFHELPAPPTLEERVRRLEIYIWGPDGEPRSWILNAVADENADDT